MTTKKAKPTTPIFPTIDLDSVLDAIEAPFIKALVDAREAVFQAGRDRQDALDRARWERATTTEAVSEALAKVRAYAVSLMVIDGKLGPYGDACADIVTFIDDAEHKGSHPRRCRWRGTMSGEVSRLDAHDIDAMAVALELRDVQQGGSPHITPGNVFYREAAAALLACLPPRSPTNPATPVTPAPGEKR